MTTMSPGRSAGTRHAATYASKQPVSVAPSNARQADSGTPPRRTAAVRVTTFQWPCGTGPSTRLPLAARPSVRPIAVFAPLSSMKAIRAGSIAANSSRRAARSALNPGRSCSAARRASFFA